MTRFSLSLSICMVLSAIALRGQPSTTLVLPGTGRGADARRTPESASGLANYGNNRREAALAAFQAGFTASTKEGKRDRATRLMLLALHRDPALDGALYDIGILCAQYGIRWEDAVRFQQEAQKRADPGSDIARLAAAELERVQAIAELEATPEGSKRRQYYKNLVAAATAKDVTKALIAAIDLSRQDPGRWEGQALAGILEAESGDYPASVEKLSAAQRLAPVERRPQIQAALEIARREVAFTSRLERADGLWRQQKYEEAAKTWSEAWESSPGRADIGMRAATGFLMADEVAPAVQVLSRLRSTSEPDLDSRISAMLRQLAAVSDEARAEGARAPGGARPVSGKAAQAIRESIGTIATPVMELVARPDPALIDGTKPVPWVPDDEISNVNSNGFLSAVSIYALYERDAGPSLAVAPPAEPVTPEPPPLVPAGAEPPEAGPAARVLPPRPVSAPPVEKTPAQSVATRPAASKGPGLQVDAITDPPGASIVFDADAGNPAPLVCIAPCRAQLSAGRHTLRATMAGYRDALHIFEVARNAQAVAVKLDAKRGRIRIESTPSGLDVSLNGKGTGKVTPVDFLLNEGDYEIGVVIEGVPVLRKVTIQDEGTGRVRFGQTGSRVD